MELVRKKNLKVRWDKRTRKTISLEQKLIIIQRAEQGEKAVNIAEELGLPSSSVRSILSKSTKIRKTAKVAHSKNKERLEYIKRLKVSDCYTVETISTPGETKSAFVSSFKQLVKQNGYKTKQIFHVAETVLFWKEMPTKHVSRTVDCIPEYRERVTLLLGGNASGDFKLKPLLVHYLENPRSLKGYPKDKLPVTWRTSSRTQMTQLIFSDWFTGYFCPAVEQYCRIHKLDNKVLLLLNDNPCHPTTLDDLSNDVQVINLPQGIHDLIWPVDLSIFKIFKTHYLHRVLSQTTAAIEANTTESLIDFCDNYDIKEAINNIAGAWEDVPPSTMNLFWKNLYPDCVRGNSISVNKTDTVFQNITELANNLGVDIDRCDIMELLVSRNEEMSDDEALQLEKFKAREQFMNEDYEDILPIKSLSPPLLREAMTHIEAAMAIYKEHDPDSGRSSLVCRNIEKAVATYRQLERIKRNGKHTITDFYRSISGDLLISPEIQSVHSCESQSPSYTFDVTFIKEEAPST